MIPLFTNATNDKYMLLHEVALATTYVALLQNIDHNSLVNQGPYFKKVHLSFRYGHFLLQNSQSYCGYRFENSHNLVFKIHSKF